MPRLSDRYGLDDPFGDDDSFGNAPPIVPPFDPDAPRDDVINQRDPVVPAAVVSAGRRGGGGAGIDPYAGFSGKPQFNFGQVPLFDYPEFHAPTFEQAQNEPGYRFRLNAGSDALERSAAARGTLRTGGTLKDILTYGQNFGAQEYSNVFNRSLSSYDRQYQGVKDAYAPRLAEWQLKAQAEAQATLAQYQRLFDIYTFSNRNSGYRPPQEPPPEKKDVAYYGA